VSELQLHFSGYVCVPYSHNHESVELKELWENSKNIEELHFVTGTFSSDSRSFFPELANHYLLAKFIDNEKIYSELQKFNQENTSFVFNIEDELFNHEVEGERNFLSVYYLEYGKGYDEFQEIANLLVKKNQIETACLGNMMTFSTIPPKFKFPYSDNIVIIEVASEKSHQSVKKYCEQTKKDANRRGLTLTNFLSLSILENLKSKVK
jgi:hypothetical protein